MLVIQTSAAPKALEGRGGQQLWIGTKRQLPLQDPRPGHKPAAGFPTPVEAPELVSVWPGPGEPRSPAPDVESARVPQPCSMSSGVSPS